jgi:hypothetical protein
MSGCAYLVSSGRGFDCGTLVHGPHEWTVSLLLATLQVTDFYAIGPHEFEYGSTVAEGAKEAGVTHFVWSTLPNVDEQSGGKYDVPHFTDKARVGTVSISST